MKLIIDIGNSFSKVAVFENKELKDSLKIKNIQVNDIVSFINNRIISSSILSSVVFHNKNINEYLKNMGDFIELNEKTIIPIQNLYKTPATLGKDRLAGIVGASCLFPDENILVIDTGTCIKYDFINKNNEYLGGAISPGIEMRLKSLHEFTEKLPHCKPNLSNKLIGTTTEESILSGVINGTIAELDGIIDQYKSLYQPIKIILSGGDMIYFDKRLKNSIFAVSNIVLLGLNEILDYNVK